MWKEEVPVWYETLSRNSLEGVSETTKNLRQDNTQLLQSSETVLRPQVRPLHVPLTTDEHAVRMCATTTASADS
jgi:hypothetical protein